MGFRIVAAAGLALFAAVPAQAAWWKAQSRHFTVYSEGNDEKLRDFAERLEKFDFLLRKVTGLKDPEADSPVEVFLLSNDARVKKLARNPNLAGFYTTSDRVAYAVLSRESKSGKFDFGAEEVLFHEYTHHFMLHHFPAAYPAWYIEGFAEFFSVVKFAKDGSIDFGNVPMARVPGLVLASPYPLKKLFESDTEGLNRIDGDRYYGTAWLLTHYFQYGKAERRQEFIKYLNDLAKGVADVQPDTYFAGGLDGLEKDVKAYMRQRLTASRLTPRDMTLGAIAITAVDPARGELIEDELRLRYRPTAEELPALIDGFRAVTVTYPASAYAFALLADAEWEAERKDAALADADRAIAIDPAMSRAYATRAEVLLERAYDSDKDVDWKAALSAIVKANRADTEDPVPLALFYRYNAMRGGKMPDLGYDGLYKAFTLLPQNPTYRMNFAQAVAARGDYRAASRLLDPIAYSPHASGMREAAIKMKAAFDAQAAGKDVARDAVKAGEAAGNPAPAP
ncbi:tetratricopeptide (TPR) repeat protein [Sphingobium sp. OAS761]|uniref:DUF1570 domain-containing protein n=1 Tax=Sphingobium sp. OAS761 TaxID=2817901 RepID=UPI0020A21F35|nr:DUF1570 domain-containing protein [Sphingobium sp. OAS761]MCP1471196.1 tetratricopeptide (TPR) repeat protein [Sphingobium sp. OAS761]